MMLRFISELFLYIIVPHTVRNEDISLCIVIYLTFGLFSSLFCTVPPQPPKIFNDRGEHIQSRAGPYEEGGDLHLICVVMGGTYKYIFQYFKIQTHMQHQPLCK